jgi:hypothetical protein
MNEEDDNPLSKWRTRHKRDPLDFLDDNTTAFIQDAINSGNKRRIIAVILLLAVMLLLPAATLAIIFYLEAHK